MLRLLVAIFGFLPIGLCRRGTGNRFWRNRRGGPVVFLGDVLGNVVDAARLFVFRTPKDAYVVRDEYGNIKGTISRPQRGRKP